MGEFSTHVEFLVPISELAGIMSVLVDEKSLRSLVVVGVRDFIGLEEELVGGRVLLVLVAEGIEVGNLEIFSIHLENLAEPLAEDRADGGDEVEERNEGLGVRFWEKNGVLGLVDEEPEGGGGDLVDLSFDGSELKVDEISDDFSVSRRWVEP